MISRLALAAAVGLLVSTAASAETYVSPDRGWWKQFFSAVDGTTPDLEAMAKKDPAYLAANEFDRDDVLASLVAELQQQHAQIDVATAEVTIGIRATLGDYSTEQRGFPVSLFAANMHLPLDGNSLFFRNFATFGIFPATKEEGKMLRERIGTQPLAADITLTNIQKSTTRPRAYDGFITEVVYTAQDGLVVGHFTDVEAAAPAADDAAAMVAGIREKIIDKAGIPTLGTSWEKARALIQGQYPYGASDTFAYTDRGKVIAYQYDQGTTVMDAPHEADKTFRIYLQQAEGSWRTKSGFSFDMDAGDTVSVKGTGPGLGCYTPEVLDRCAVLEFSPSDGDHILTRAYGVIELERTGSPQEALDAFVGEHLDATDGFATKVDYDADSVVQARVPQYIGQRGVAAYAAEAGVPREGKPFYDPLQNTTRVNPITREIALFAVDGAPDRIPLIFVLQ